MRPQKILPGMAAFMAELRGRITVGVVGASGFSQQKEQLGENGARIVFLYFTSHTDERFLFFPSVTTNLTYTPINISSQ